MFFLCCVLECLFCFVCRDGLVCGFWKTSWWLFEVCGVLPDCILSVAKTHFGRSQVGTYSFTFPGMDFRVCFCACFCDLLWFVARFLIHTDLGHTENLNYKRQVATLPEESVYSRPVFLHRGHSLTCWQDFEQFCNFGDVWFFCSLQSTTLHLPELEIPGLCYSRHSVMGNRKQIQYLEISKNIFMDGKIHMCNNMYV